jgi:hypothetical protein
VPPTTTTQSVLVFLSVIFTLFAYRRRRNRRANLAYIQQTQPGSGAAALGSPYSGAGGSPPFAPQYPPPTHNGNYPYNYNPNSGFAPVRGHLPLLVFPPHSSLADAHTLDFFFLFVIAWRPAPAVLCAAIWRAPDHIAQVKCCVRGFLKVSSSGFGKDSITFMLILSPRIS